jgi:HipA-like protein
MNGERVGRWVQPARGAQEFHYAGSWLAAPNHRPLSLSLQPVPGAMVLRGLAVEAWFENLLPDSAAIRQRVQQRFRPPAVVPSISWRPLVVIARGLFNSCPPTSGPPDWIASKRFPLQTRRSGAC